MNNRPCSSQVERLALVGAQEVAGSIPAGADLRRGVLAGATHAAGVTRTEPTEETT